MSNENCIFCKIVHKEIKSEIVFETENFLAIKDAHPKTTGHTLIIPKKHFTNLLDFSEDLGYEFIGISKKVGDFLINTNFGAGFNVIMNNFAEAGQVVMHAHWHFIPRKEGDGLKTIA